jgi:hypothetical protein
MLDKPESQRNRAVAACAVRADREVLSHEKFRRTPMLKLPKLRIALAAVTMLGAAHLRTASAAENQPGCVDYAVAVGTAACDAATGGDWTWGIVWYTEYSDGSCSVDEVDCFST